MTLDPVFRSRAAVRQIEEDGFLEHMRDSLNAHRETLAYTSERLPDIISKDYLELDGVEEPELDFLQSHFFLILFHSIFESLGPSPERLRFYARTNFCIKGLVTAGDNVFDDEDKMLIPLRAEGTRFANVLQLLCFDRLIQRVSDDARDEGWLGVETARTVHRALLDRLAEIGALEGSEEHGVDRILPVDQMIAEVHRLRGGMLFSLAFTAPKILEQGDLRQKFEKAERAIQHLGTAFQIVDDLTDFEFDLTRRSHNILVAAAFHEGDADARAAIERLWNGEPPEADMVETVFASAARSALGHAEREGRRAFELLRELGFWFPPDRSDLLIHAIVGIEGVSRMERLTS